MISVRIEARHEDRAFLIASCPFGGECKWSIWKREASGAMWHWDGSIEAPTISPSINCHSCGQHFTVTSGVAE
ncbi:DUF6527 family protein [Mesorhizobium sp.]|uniref:DUF6527 family protein n=1 Tax=Mesorhizobium sp. TaxID=1871066 RepID=UPI00344ED619